MKTSTANFPIAGRVQALVESMSLAEKIGQMTQVEKNSIVPKEVGKYFIGSVLSGAGGYPQPNTPEAWIEMVNSFQSHALRTRLAIPLLYGVDAVHGHNNMFGAVIFPHNVGLGASGNADLVYKISQATGEEMLATGIYWNFAPTLAVPQDIRWGRTYEGYSEDTTLVTKLGAAYLKGMQGERLDSPHSVLATPKHYLGDGGTAWGTSSFFNYMLDQGITQVDEAELRRIHLPPYISAIKHGALCIMASFSSWNGEKIAANRYLLTDVLKIELGFRGFIISDWQSIDQISPDYYQAVTLAINAGIDMSMVPYDYRRFITTLQYAVERGDVSETRINDAVSRILLVKLTLGLFDKPASHPGLLSRIGSKEHRALARQAVSESMVLLKNDRQILPLPKNIPLVLVGGKGADNIGFQCGGWTSEWNGIDGNKIPGTSILQGIMNKVARSTRIIFDPAGKFDVVTNAGLNSAEADVGIAVVGEPPYAEGLGDREDLGLSQEDSDLIHSMRARCHLLVVILVSGRPMIITGLLPITDAFVCVWLPGQEGEGIADVLFGDKPFTGCLPYTWPKNMGQLPINIHNAHPKENAPLFPLGFGLKI